MTIPDKWLVLKIDGEELIYKVFGSWSGGYLDGDSWKLNSGIESVEETNDAFLFKGFSGSVYKCRKNSYGSNAYGAAIINGWMKESDKISIMDEKTDWLKLFKT